jgi:dihydrolipoamide dehydrogenase
MEDRDIVIIGGGPAGYVAAIRVAQIGGKATLIENDAIGGTCLNRGCIPTRALLRGVEFLDLAKSARDYGVSYTEPELDLARMMARKATIVKTVVSGVRLLLEGNGVEVINGRADFLSPSQLEVKLGDGTKRELAARRVIIATGSRSRKTAISGAKVIDTTQALEIEEVPKSMLVIGGGFIGLAFATIFSRLGTAVSVVEPSRPLLAEIDNEVVSILEKELKKAKIQFYDQAPADLTADYVLTTEREANTEGLGLDRAGVELNDKGGIRVNGYMETSAPNIFAAGDVTMERMWTHVAFAEGLVAAQNALGKGSEIDYSVIPYLAHTLPEIAAVGITEEEAARQGYQLKIGRFPLAANANATILGQRTGTIKLISEAKYGQILGVHIIGPQASLLIAEAALAMKLDATPEDIGLTMHGHPTLSEALWEAARDASGETIHFISPNR